ncbi:hydroxyisourate hydrolase [Paenibacillus sp. 2TAB19]|uniref:hydroxyisourate hydrolase n=1 Tax=Paenibacillus sp. 2TAB19 TaxID=3233003 RepID=UPI003F9C9343
MGGRISTHVLDTAGGKPVEGLVLTLTYFGDGETDEYAKVVIGTYKTNSDGRVDQPLLEGEALKRGTYELLFMAGDYFRSAPHLSLVSDPIFDAIPIRFKVTDETGHYHVPLLVAPGGFSTYRGS